LFFHFFLEYSSIAFVAAAEGELRCAALQHNGYNHKKNRKKPKITTAEALGEIGCQQLLCVT
jgi:hypothetical protein